MDVQNGQNPWFIVKSYAHSNGFNFVLDSCTSRNVETVYASSNDSYNFPIRPWRAEFTSSPTNKYSQIIAYTGQKYRNTNIMISVNQPMSRQYSIFTNTRSYDTRPYLTKFATHFIERKGQFDRYSFDIPQIYSDYYPLFIEVVVVDQAEPGINLYTVCGIRNTNNSRVINTYFIWEPEEQSFMEDLNIDDNHAVTVVMTDWYYRTSSSNVIILPATNRPVPPQEIRLSVGAFIMMIVSVLIVLYLLIGMAVKKLIYKSSGLDLIPNVDFWKDTPFLFVDGIKLVVTCGRRSNQGYSETKEESTTTKEENPFGNTGYGTI